MQAGAGADTCRAASCAECAQLRAARVPRPGSRSAPAARTDGKQHEAPTKLICKIKSAPSGWSPSAAAPRAGSVDTLRLCSFNLPQEGRLLVSAFVTKRGMQGFLEGAFSCSRRSQSLPCATWSSLWWLDPQRTGAKLWDRVQSVWEQWTCWDSCWWNANDPPWPCQWSSAPLWLCSCFFTGFRVSWPSRICSQHSIC